MTSDLLSSDAADRRPAATAVTPEREVVIEPSRGWRAIDFREVFEHRDLLWNLAWRSIKGRYAQSALGLGWMLVQPLITLLIFTIVFGRVVRIKPPGGGPYAAFVFCGMVPWLYFSGALVAASGSLVAEAQVLSKVYFPRLILPLSSVLGRLLDLGITFAVLLVLLAGFGIVPRPAALVMVPALTLVMTAAVLGAGLGLSALAIQYRDVAHALAFLTQIWMYLSPVFYPVEFVPDRFRLLYGLNPMVGVIQGFRSCLLGTGPTPWGLIAEGTAVALVFLAAGALYFRRSERLFADVI